MQTSDHQFSQQINMKSKLTCNLTSAWDKLILNCCEVKVAFVLAKANKMLMGKMK